MAGSRAYKEAHKYFGLKKGDGLVLHHVDQTLRHTNRKRYDEWRPEDLIVMTKESHASLHHKGKKRPPFSEETRKKISTANRGQKRSEETKKKISTAKKGQIPWTKGKKLSEVHKKRIGDAHRGKKRLPFSEETKKKLSKSMIGKNATPVCQYTLDGKFVKEWSSMTDAEKEGGFNHGSIIRVCKGKYRHHKGYIWRYVNAQTEP